MRIRVLNSSTDGVSGRQFAASYLVNGRVAIDAGSIGMLSSVQEQRNIGHVFLSHPHMDHIASLPVFLDNVYQQGPRCPTIYGNEFVRESLLRDVFNGRLWPDLPQLSQEESPFFRFELIESGGTIVIDELRITPIALNHVVPTLGFIIEDETAAIVIVSDTSPTEEIWSVAGNNRKLRAVFLEAAFPSSMAWLAEKAAHLTPLDFRAEYLKLNRDVPVYAVHIKPAYYDEVVAELAALGIDQLRISEANCDYEFS